jgi:hypothetical protein
VVDVVVLVELVVDVVDAVLVELVVVVVGTATAVSAADTRFQETADVTTSAWQAALVLSHF